MTRAQATRHDAAALAEEAYVFAYPLVLMDHAMNLRTSNRLVHDGRMADTLRISAWLDLDAEPIVISAPDTRGRYYVLCLRDAWNTMLASAGARTTGTEERAFAVLGPGRHGAHLPVGVTPIAAPTRIAHLAGCLEALGDDEDPDLERITAGFRLAPLSRCHEVDDDASATPPGPPAAAAAEQVEGLDARSFFGEALQLVAENPPEPGDRPALQQLREIAPLEDPATWQQLGPEWHAALTEGVRRGREAVRAIAGGPLTEGEGHWRVSYDGGRYGTDYLRRARVARAGLGADPATDELTAQLDTDAEGRPLTGRSRYLLRFAPDAPPPVRGFWVLTTYPVASPSGAHPQHFSTGDLHGLTLDRDGSLPIHIQHGAPARERKANWLPAPPGRFDVVLRLFWPREEALSGQWSPPVMTRVESCPRV